MTTIIRVELSPQEIKVLSRTQKIIVGENKSVSVVNAGPIGPAGPPGLSISSAIGEQIAPLAIWIIDHNLEFFPAAVKFYSLDGEDELEPTEISYVNNNQILAFWPTPIAGTWMVS